MGVMKTMIMVMVIFLAVSGWAADVHYALDVRVDTVEKKITGAARLRTGADKKIDLNVRNLSSLKVDGNFVPAREGEMLSLSIKAGKETLITYEASYREAGDNVIDRDNVFLNGTWYPQPDVPVQYALTVTLPKDFVAVSEAEVIKEKELGKTKTFSFLFEHPLESLHLAASTRYVLKKGTHKDTAIEAYFFEEDAQMADAYIAAAKKYLKMYEAMLTPFPYPRFALVQNIFPSGGSRPTYALLGAGTVREKAINETSLGRHVLRQWFGNSVYVDSFHGNWATGLTHYLAEHHDAELAGKGREYRKGILVNYEAYVKEDNAISVSEFNNPRNRAQVAVGNGRTAMIFHGLRVRYGDKAFFAALREFIRNNSFRQASWHDIQKAFDRVSGERLYMDFGHWINRKDIPHLTVEDAELRVEHGQLKLNFTLLQEGEPAPLRLPLTLYMGTGTERRTVDVKNSKEKITLALSEPPLKVVIDENYDLMRRLEPEEVPPVLHSVMGREKLMAVVSSAQKEIYQPLFDGIGVGDITYVSPQEVTFAQMKESSFLIAGFDNRIASMLFGRQAVPQDGVRLKVYKNPYNPEERIALLHVKNRAEGEGLKEEISQYGRYTEIALSGGRVTHKSTAEAKNGIEVLTREPTLALRPDRPATIDDLLPKLLGSRVVYVGEKHDQFAHHINQLLIIKKFHEAGYKLAVGMEMFQRPYQQTVDDYLSGRIDERAFLKKSEYFTRWHYDYNLYKPIIDFLKEHGIPLLALNVEGSISRKVAREGLQGLTDEEKKSLPAGMDFSGEQYRRDLIEVFSLHEGQADLKDFNYFLQAQILWDEGMAEAAQHFLASHPGYRLVILAGNGHVRFKYGIPERLYRRNRLPFTVVVQDEEMAPSVADYVLFTTKLKGETSPKLGVLVEEKEEGLLVGGVSDKTPAKKAGLKKGDIIVGFAGDPIKSLADLKIALFYSKLGQKYKIQLKRGGKTLEKEIELFRSSKFSPHYSPR